MTNLYKKLNSLKITSFIKQCSFFFFLMIKNSTAMMLLKNLKKNCNKLRFSKKTKKVLMNSIISYFPALVSNSVIFIELKTFSLISINNFLLKFMLAVRISNKIYSKYCFTRFLNSYCYFQNKKLLFKTFVFRLKSLNY